MTRGCATRWTSGWPAWMAPCLSNICRCSAAPSRISIACSASGCSTPCSAALAPACPAAPWRRTRPRFGHVTSRVSQRFSPRGRPMSEDRDRRWRLALGGEDEALSQGDQRLSGALTALYGEGDGDEKKRKGGLGASAPNVARWMSDIREYFPSPVGQIVQKDAFDRLGLQRMLLEPDVLAAVEADINLVATLISLRNVLL